MTTQSKQHPRELTKTEFDVFKYIDDRFALTIEERYELTGLLIKTSEQIQRTVKAGFTRSMPTKTKDRIKLLELENAALRAQLDAYKYANKY